MIKIHKKKNKIGQIIFFGCYIIIKSMFVNYYFYKKNTFKILIILKKITYNVL